MSLLYLIRTIDVLLETEKRQRGGKEERESGGEVVCQFSIQQLCLGLLGNSSIPVLHVRNRTHKSVYTIDTNGYGYL